MKRTIFILSVSFLLYACGDKPENPTPEPPPYQLYTSLVVWHNIDGDPKFILYHNGIVGYPDSTGYWHKIDTIGELTKGVFSHEIIIDTSLTKSVHLFFGFEQPLRGDTTFYLIPNIKNVIELPLIMRGIEVDKDNHFEYPF
ncbi:MAG: hypothetical protein LBQ31_09300 [Bacteroidales bacterium]|jgi:hypothetical protein|nr:hypothetical protein [Bacteroidales bacterium]